MTLKSENIIEEIESQLPLTLDAVNFQQQGFKMQKSLREDYDLAIRLGMNPERLTHADKLRLNVERIYERIGLGK